MAKDERLGRFRWMEAALVARSGGTVQSIWFKYLEDALIDCGHFTKNSDAFMIEVWSSGVRLDLLSEGDIAMISAEQKAEKGGYWDMRAQELHRNGQRAT